MPDDGPALFGYVRLQAGGGGAGGVQLGMSLATPTLSSEPRLPPSTGHGAIAVDGRLVNKPIVERARRLLEYQQATGQRYAQHS